MYDQERKSIPTKCVFRWADTELTQGIKDAIIYIYIYIYNDSTNSTRHRCLISIKASSYPLSTLRRQMFL